MANPNDIRDPQSFIDFYGLDAEVVVGRIGNEMRVPLGEVLEQEELFCPADKADRQDPTKRLSYLAGMLAAGGSLLPEHMHLLNTSEPV